MKTIDHAVIKTDFSTLIKRLNQLAVLGLAEMFDFEKQLFCFRVKKTDSGLIKEGLSLRYTIISLLGLHRFEIEGGKSPVDIEKTIDVILDNFDDINNIGDLGLLLWLCSLAAPHKLQKISFDFNIRDLKSKFHDARNGKTTELAWFLSGLCHLALTGIVRSEKTEEIAMYICNMIKQNYGGRGIFGHQANNSFTGIVRGRIGSFADQVYPIYAFCKLALAYNNREALKIATECGETICNLQGPYGQWWWHYDAISGKVIGRYPVYSVHQHGMAPMALYELSRSSGINFDDHISKSVSWITGENEMNFNLIDLNRNVIWRSFYRKKYRMYHEEILSLLEYSNDKKDFNDMTILYECRPYCLGWFLYAFTDKKI